MRWSVGFLDEETKAALDAFPLDIRASFQRIVELIQAHGLESPRALPEASRWPTLGDAAER